MMATGGNGMAARHTPAPTRSSMAAAHACNVGRVATSVLPVPVASRMSTSRPWATALKAATCPGRNAYRERFAHCSRTDVEEAPPAGTPARSVETGAAGERLSPAPSNGVGWARARRVPAAAPASALSAIAPASSSWPARASETGAVGGCGGARRSREAHQWASWARRGAGWCRRGRGPRRRGSASHGRRRSHSPARTCELCQGPRRARRGPNA